jgi:hypothetical protein
MRTQVRCSSIALTFDGVASQRIMARALEIALELRKARHPCGAKSKTKSDRQQALLEAAGSGAAG